MRGTVAKRLRREAAATVAWLVAKPDGKVFAEVGVRRMYRRMKKLYASGVR